MTPGLSVSCPGQGWTQHIEGGAEGGKALQTGWDLSQPTSSPKLARIIQAGFARSSLKIPHQLPSVVGQKANRQSQNAKWFVGILSGLVVVIWYFVSFWQFVRAVQTCFMIIDFFVKIYFWIWRKAYLLSTFAEPTFSRTQHYLVFCPNLLPPPPCVKAMSRFCQSLIQVDSKFS